MNANTYPSPTPRSDANALLAQLSHVEAQQEQRPARLPPRLDAAQPGDTLVLVDCRGGVHRRLVGVEALDDGAIVAEGERFDAGNGFHLDGLRSGNLDRMIQPVDAWSWPGWDASMSLEF